MFPIHLCIGASRSGMTWVFDEMRKHPDLFVPEAREVRYWNSPRSDAQRDAFFPLILQQLEKQTDIADSEIAAQRAWLDTWSTISRDDAPSMQTYTKLMSQSGRASLDISPSYCLMPTEQIEKLRAELPAGSKVFYLMADPLDRLASQVKLHFHQQGSYRGRPSRYDLADFLKNPLQQRRWDYAGVIEDWAKVFGDDFIPLTFEAGMDATALRTSIVEALGLDPSAQALPEPAEAFFPVEKNQEAQIWVSSFGPAEEKVLAQALLPAIEAFSPRSPAVASPWLAKLQARAEATPPGPEPIDDVDHMTQKLMRMTESLGDNCEYGFWQRHRGYEPSSLFRWAITPIDSLLAFLEAPAPLYAAKDLSVHSPGMVGEARFGLKFHSRLVERAPDESLRLLSDAAAFEKQRAEEADKISHLQAKFFVQLKRQGALYIVKDNQGTDEARARSVLAHLHRHNPQHHLLWVEADGAPSLKDLGGGLLRGSLPEFAKYSSADVYAKDGWTTLMTQASQLDSIAKQIAQMQR